MPIQYEPGILQEHLATRKFGGLFDVSHMVRFRIKGKGRIPFLQHVLSNNAEALDPWQAQYTLIPNENGGVIDDAYLYRFGVGRAGLDAARPACDCGDRLSSGFEGGGTMDDYLLVANASNREKDWTHLQKSASIFEGVTIEDHTDKIAMIAFQGPLTGRILAGLVEYGTLPEPFHNRLSEIGLCGTKVLIARTGYTGEPIG
ncbi:MAG: hypothetical protein NTV79_00765, partial [Candidatus Aureabacteria bacterium]|nr:hypothetical protein [Candidatus Auribacterota bacterium]